jgi:Domain of unknown function (DUF6391)
MANLHYDLDFWGLKWLSPTLDPWPTWDSELRRQVGFVPGLSELLLLRQVHALEHATVWVLGGQVPSSPTDDNRFGGMSTERGFYLYGEVSTADLSRAVGQALRRITSGEWQLAVHPRCGTNLSVGMVLAAGLALGTSVVLPRGPIEQLLGLGMATMTAAQLAPDLGQWVQQYVTTAIPFNLRVRDITLTQDDLGRSAHFVAVQWIGPAK